MSEAKYDKYFQKQPIRNDWTAIYPQLTAETFNVKGREWDKPCILGWYCIDKPFTMIDEPHAHEFDQFLCFYGGNPKVIRDFGGTIELFLGTELEKHVITSPSVVHIPKGFIHCPLIFKEIRQPIVFMDIMLTKEYVRNRDVVFKPAEKK